MEISKTLEKILMLLAYFLVISTPKTSFEILKIIFYHLNWPNSVVENRLASKYRNEGDHRDNC